ncbi:DNA-methyltransferase [Saccharopolyspora endophytica]|uniref:Methyltransferase n=1 Tax=Saccharopolyspora endophytica TaxID=543886 RepID=A0ABS5DKA9_9PSEU|nr:site-specific DNA-methyltransferase [Saccharopolyspora endophytica]MBQ0926719.1 site-specific DNA-methyltransferase [Saccharopolyspora endophytica]
MTGRGPVVIRGDARTLPLPDESVNLVCTSPPYWGLRSYQDAGEHDAGQIGTEATAADYLDALVACMRECCRVLAPDGSLWVNLGDTYAGTRSLCGLPWRFALRCCDDLGLLLRAEVIWSKTNGLPESVTDRVRRNHETWIHFTRSDRYFNGDQAFSRRIQHPGTGKHEQRAAWTAENSLPNR